MSELDGDLTDLAEPRTPRPVSRAYLDSRIERAATMMMAGASIDQIARDVGASAGAVRAWLRTDAAQARVRQINREASRRAVNVIAAAQSQAARTLLTLCGMTDEQGMPISHKNRIDASMNLLRLGAMIGVQADMEEPVDDDAVAAKIHDIRERLSGVRIVGAIDTTAESGPAPSRESA